MKTIIIAEAGVNHNGNIDLAKKLIDVAAEAGVDYVKFQSFKSEKLVTRTAAMADYQMANMNQQLGAQFDMLKKLELSLEDHDILIQHCRQKKVNFLSTAFDLDSADLLYSLGVEYFKVPSGEITNLPFLKKLAGFRKKMIISTGMSTMEDIERALAVVVENGTSLDSITVLHCNTEYPTPFEDVNLKAMQFIGNHFGVKVGYSDHTAGIEVPIAAVALGACMIEKHFTLDKTMEGPDHKASLEPAELIQMVKSIRNIEKALGRADKVPSPSEIKNISIARKSIHLSKAVAKHSMLTEADLQMLRPGDGISPMDLPKVLGRKLKLDLKENHKLSWDDLSE
ncbi:MAG: N-acetylneuraminate synthase [Flavobacteriales bacterium]